MARERNFYCSGPDCLRTRKHFEVGDHWICRYCRKLLYKAPAR